MSLINESQLKSFSKKLNYAELASILLESYKLESKANKTSIFLSHKHEESSINLHATISFLKQFVVDIYVDWLDEGMPEKTSAQTVVKRKQQICYRRSDKLQMV